MSSKSFFGLTRAYAHVTDRKVDEDMKRLRMQSADSDIMPIDESMDTGMKGRRRHKKAGSDR